MQSLKTSIERLASLGEVEGNPEARKTFLQFRDALTRGEIRAAEKRGGCWVVNLPCPPIHGRGSSSCGPGWVLGATGRVRGAVGHLHASDVH